MTHLLHECIAHQRSLDVRLDSLLSSCPNLNRGLLVLHGSSSPLLSLAHSNSFLLLSFLSFTASLADKVSFTLTDVGTMTLLLHECIAHYRSLAIRLDSLLSSRSDHNHTSSHSAAPAPLSSPSPVLIPPSSSPSSPPPPPSPIKSPIAFASSTSPSLERISPSLTSTLHFTIRSPSILLDNCSPSKTMTLSLHQEFVVRWGSLRAELREIETCLEEIFSLMHMGEDYTELMMSKIKGLGFVDPEFGSKAVKRFKYWEF